MVGFDFNNANLTERYQAVYDIIQDIKNGKREHNQKHYHCNTAHCIAGWMEHEQMVAVHGQALYCDAFSSISDPVKNPAYTDHIDAVLGDADPYWPQRTWWWAEQILEVGARACELFDMELTIEEIEKNLLRFASERDIELKTGQSIRETIQPSSLWQQQLEGQRVSCGTSTN